MINGLSVDLVKMDSTSVLGITLITSVVSPCCLKNYNVLPKLCQV